MVDSLNYSYDYGELSNSQKEAIITLIEKKDKDKRHLSNWRPISLINVDVKIGSKAIAKRLQNVLPNALMSKEGPSSMRLEQLRMLWNFQNDITSKGK